MRQMFLSSAVLASCLIITGASAQQADVTFFVTSVGPAKEPTSAESRGLTPIVNHLHKQLGREAKPGAPI